MRRLSAVLSLIVAMVGCGGTSPTSPGSPTVSTYAGTVSAYGLASHPHTASGAGTATVSLTWTGGADLDLYVTGASCTGYPPDACVVLARSTASSGSREEVSMVVAAGQSLTLWVDNFSTQAGVAYTLTVSTS